METVELYRKHRPTNLDEVLGQSDAVSAVKEMLEARRLPHALLLSGPSGVGKTTICRILKDQLECSDYDFYEINAADTRGIDTIRDIRTHMSQKPLKGKTRIWLLDECHQLSKRAGGDAQTCLLKMLEDTPSHVYFFLATTDPGQLLVTIRNRCTEIRLKSMDREALCKTVKYALARERIKFTDQLLNVIADAADGSARKALVLAHSAMFLESDEERIAAVYATVEQQRTAKDLMKALLFERGSTWKSMAAILKNLEDTDWESIRYLILKCATDELLKASSSAPRAYAIIRAFDCNFYDSKRAGLVAACYQVMSEKV